jgi:hypothetical protein
MLRFMGLNNHFSDTLSVCPCSLLPRLRHLRSFDKTWNSALRNAKMRRSGTKMRASVSASKLRKNAGLEKKAALSG